MKKSSGICLENHLRKKKLFVLGAEKAFLVKAQLIACVEHVKTFAGGSEMNVLSDFKDVLDDVQELFDLSEGKHKVHWTKDRTKEYHAKKAIGHVYQAMGDLIEPEEYFVIDEDSGKSHDINAIARLLIAAQRNKNGF